MSALSMKELTKMFNEEWQKITTPEFRKIIADRVVEERKLLKTLNEEEKKEYIKTHGIRIRPL